VVTRICGKRKLIDFRSERFCDVGVAPGKPVTANTMLKVRFKLKFSCFDPIETDVRLGDLLDGKLLSFPVQGPQTDRRIQGQFSAEFSFRLQCSAMDLTSASCPLVLPGQPGMPG
jgi:hypothetical protein